MSSNENGKDKCVKENYKCSKERSNVTSSVKFGLNKKTEGSNKNETVKNNFYLSHVYLSFSLSFK